MLRLWGFCDRCRTEFGATFDSFKELAETAAANAWRPICPACRAAGTAVSALSRA